MAGERKEAVRAEWPKHGPDFNRWNGDLLRLAALITDASNEFWWCADTQLKYLEIRCDTRDGAFVLFDRDRNAIAPERVEEAIAKWRSQHGSLITPRRPAPTGEGQ